MYRKYLQELSDRPATAHLQELSDRPATAHLQELSDRPATAHLQELSDRPATAHLQELSDRPVFPETHLIVGDAHLKAARAGAAHREQFRNSQIDCVTASISSSTTFASGDATASQPLAIQLASQTVAVECQSVSGSTGHSMHAKPGGSNITVNQSPTLQSASHDSGVVTSPSAENESRVTSSIHRPEVRSSGYGSAARRFQVVKSIGRDSAVSCSPEDKYRGWSSSASLSSGVKSKGRGSTISQSPKVKARGRSSSVSQSPEVKSRDRISSISHSAEIKSRVRGSADSHSSEVKSRRRGSVISRSSEVKSRGRGIGISHASEASYERPEKWDPHRYSETIQLEDFMSRTNTPEFRRRPVDYLVTNEEETITTKLGRSSQASRPSPKCMWDEDSFSNLSQDEVIVSRPVVDASIVNSPLYPTPRGDLILSILPEKGRHAIPSLPPDVIKVKPIHKDSQEEPKVFLRGNGLTRPPSRFSSNIQVEMSPWGRHSPAPRTTQSASDSSGVAVDGAEDQITYSWNTVNVFSNPDAAASSGFLRKKKKESTEKHILKNVTGICRPGELLAIMGASGAGKTTLLNVLTHRNNDKLRVTGDLYVNGRAVDPDALTSRSAYVQQDDLFIGMLTVREQLKFQAMLRMDRHLTFDQRMTRVDEVISELGLIKCADTKIGVPGRIKGISGGEMKRLAFACEVLTNPPLMFCDEPTSGLDSFMAQNVVAVMKNMAERGKTIISTIHQPSSEVYAMFDRVLLMAEGRVAFLGEVDAAYQFFNRIGLPCPPNYNPADFFISTLAVQPGKEESCRKAITMICDEFGKSEEGVSISRAVKENSNEMEQERYNSLGDHEVRKSPYKASWWTQFRNVLWRSWLEVIREPMLIKVRFLQVMAIALLIGMIYWGQQLTQEGITNINGALFLLLTNMTFQNVFGVVSTFCAQLPIFLREHFNGMYRADVYFLSKMAAETPFHITYPFAFVAIVYNMVGFTGDYVNFFICAGIVVLVANCAISFGYMISCMAKNLSVALAISAPFIIPLMLFGGFFLNSGSTPTYLTWMKYLSWFSYGNEALLVNQWKDVEKIACDKDQTCFPNGLAVLSFLHYENGSIIYDVFCLLILSVAYRTVAFFALLAKTYRKQ